MFEAFRKGSSNCWKPGHGANKCADNINLDKRCTNCGKMGHGLETDWIKPRNAVCNCNLEAGKQNRISVINNAEKDSTFEEDSTFGNE